MERSATEKDQRRLYRPERAEGRFDAIVIGSGIGGLAAAALLSLFFRVMSRQR